MQESQLRHAKAKLAAAIHQALQGEPSIIIRHGRREAVILSFEKWERLSHVPSLGRLLIEAPLELGYLPVRQDGMREIEL